MARAAGRDERGFTLIELLVTVAIFAMLSTAIMTTIMSISRATEVTKVTTDINQEARLAIDRMTRELRQARELYTATSTSIDFGVDFNGDGTIDDYAVDPEHLTYNVVTVSGTQQRIELTANDGSVVVTRPILASQVYGFTFSYRSSLYLCDANGDGITTWQEMDASSLAVCHGNNNGILDDELQNVDSIALSFYVFNDSHRQDYRTLINLRNLERT
jgi:prepilin-type N-terminal cleavage/methylation domain-containing protein